MKYKAQEKKESLFSRLKKRLKKIRYQKFVTTFLYLLLFAIIVYTFWEYNFVGAEVGAEVYSKTLDTLLGLLITTGALKGSEVFGETVQKVAELKYTSSLDVDPDVVDDMRGGE
mgnify:CR=1 FL=1